MLDINKDTFYLDGIDARKFGITLQRPLEISEPSPIVENRSVPGRNGAVLYDTGAFHNRTINASCFLLKKNVTEAILAVNSFFFAKNGYRKLETTDMPNHFWLARVTNGAQISTRARILAPFSAKFDAKPQSFRKDGENVIEMFSSDLQIFNPSSGRAKPMLTLYGTGSGTISIGDRTIIVNSMQERLYVDCETQNAYLDAPKNTNILCDDFPVFEPGLNIIKFTGDIYRMDIVPRWFDL